MPLEYVLIPWVFVKHAMSLNIIMYLFYMDVFCGIFCQLPDFKSTKSMGPF